MTSLKAKLRGVVALTVVVLSTTAVIPAHAAVLQFGDRDTLGFGSYPSDPTLGATLEGLNPGVVTNASNSFYHGFPFVPSAGDHPGTDQIYTATGQSASGEGYSSADGRIEGSLLTSFDYNSLVSPGQVIKTLTLGIAADDFQFPAFGQPFSASINGIVDSALTAQLNAINAGGPSVQFFTVGINPTILTSDNILKLKIEQLGDGRDGWAVDFFTVGVTTQASTTAVPTPALLPGLLAMGAQIWRRRRQQSS